MLLTTIPLVINTIIGVVIWMSSFSTTTKIVITVLLVLKFAIYFYTALMADSDFIKTIGLVVVELMNIAGIVYTAIFSIWTAFVPFVLLFVVLIIWRVIPEFDIPKKGGSKE